ncbi:hypothetical protein DL98DRAFT_598644 [Cadophora sp. DSE1049]|nr:hypothetical protein DL98DRAFT_598644 [Cadophora sp. DSE1049]
MRALWYDVFNDGKDIADASSWMLAEENDLAWSSNVNENNTRFNTVILDDSEDIVGAVVHLSGIESYPKLLDFISKVPWIQHGFAHGNAFPFGNFVSVQKLFHQDGKYRGLPTIERTQPFNTNPTITWYVVLSAKKVAGYDEKFGLDDALQGFRLLKSNIAEEVFDLKDPEQGKILRIKANDRGEVQKYIENFTSVREGAVNVLILRTKSTSVWDFSFF